MKNVLIISYTPVVREPRVIRQYKSLSARGYRVIVAGLVEEYENTNTKLEIIALNGMRTNIGKQFEGIRSNIGFYKKLKTFLQTIKEVFLRFREFIVEQLGMFLCNRVNILPGSRFEVSIVKMLANQGSSRTKVMVKLIAKYMKVNKIDSFDIIIAHDYFTGFAGLTLSEMFSSLKIIDIHEDPMSQYLWNSKWKRKLRMIKVLHNYLFVEIDKIFCVSSGIKNEICNNFKLPKSKVEVLKSVPSFEAKVTPSEINREISIVYSGNLSPRRGLEEAIQALGRLPCDYRLTLQGPGSARYKETLRLIAKEEGCLHRLEILNPVPFDRIVETLSKHHIGYFVADNFGAQREFALPNKFFQYIMAGLCLLVSDFKEMREIIEEYQCGFVVCGNNPTSVVDALRGIDKSSIEMAKARSLEIRKLFSWEREEYKLFKVIKEIEECRVNENGSKGKA